MVTWTFSPCLIHFWKMLYFMPLHEALYPLFLSTSKTFSLFLNLLFLFLCSLQQGVFFGLGAFSEFRITAFKHSDSLLRQKVKRKTMWRNSILGRGTNLCSPLWACLKTASSDRIAPNQHISISVMTSCPHMQSIITCPLRKKYSLG